MYSSPPLSILLLSVVWESPCMKCLNPGDWHDLLLCVRISRAAARRKDERRPSVDSRGRGKGDWKAIGVFLFYMRWYLVESRWWKWEGLRTWDQIPTLNWGLEKWATVRWKRLSWIWYRVQEHSGLCSAAERSVNYNNHHSVCNHQLLQDYFVPGTS